MEAFLGEIRLFGFDFVPKDWAPCNGQILTISQNEALYSLLGTMYGGDGQNTFALPDLQGRAPIGRGSGPGLTRRTQGDKGGSEAVTLTQNQMPQHSHQVAAAATSQSKNPANQLPGVSAAGSAYGAQPATSMAGQMIGVAGGSAPHDNMPPYLVGNWCICLVGLYPSRA
jgi:microcystin-dependent protein